MDLRPLQGYAPLDPHHPWTARDLRDAVPPLEPAAREAIACYLRSGHLVLPWMGYSEDELGGRFQVAGGNGIASDGVYYWRHDAGEYVRHYGTHVPAEAVAHFAANGWRPPELDAHEEAQIHDALWARLEEPWL